MTRGRASRLATGGLATVLCVVVGAATASRAEDDTRARAMRAEIARLRSEFERLTAQESGLLGEIARLGAAIALREAELAEVAARVAAIQGAIDERDARLHEVEERQLARRGYLEFRLREIYKTGPEATIGVVLGAQERDGALDGLRYAIYMSERDARILREYRESRFRLAEERVALLAERKQLEAARREADAALADLTAARRSRERLLAGIQRDRAVHREALSELEQASRELGNLVESVDREKGAAALDVRKFRGLLDWPASGRVTARFGKTVHPRFKTAVPHPGVDIEAPIGSDFRAIFDGRVAFAATLRGYGLTVILDHGNAVVSIYTHASVLLVSAGQQVVRGQVLGKTGDSGSMTGPKLYLEMREDGRPVDPEGWLRRR